MTYMFGLPYLSIQFPLWHYIYTMRSMPLTTFERFVIKWVQPLHFSCDASTQDCRKTQYTTTVHTMAKKLMHFWASLYKCLSRYCVSSQLTPASELFMFYFRRSFISFGSMVWTATETILFWYARYLPQQYAVEWLTSYKVYFEESILFL